MRELSKALAAIWQPVSLRATITNFHLCPLKWQNLSAVAHQRRNFAGHYFCPLPRVFSIVNTSRYAIFPACRAYARKVSMALRRTTSSSLDKSRGSRNCFLAACAPVLIKFGADLFCERWKMRQYPSEEIFDDFDYYNIDTLCDLVFVFLILIYLKNWNMI